ncbi:hypothetical protein EDD16DRAFT_1518007 [Pisolithus croceorrhizus]|nr:hypothetical protein EDD16DRAFT_1518007 [Pisolithus croceorrhizus]KAI6125273.1 hypothetical protein EV401DRAFT_1886002 [Pisolithus croceorrhizus]KAI6158898.1 hypothetical protein EDD17DRAFT_1511710 [Pisolithus thermaeus]
MNASASSIVSPNQLAVILEGAALAELDKALANLSASTLLVTYHTNQDILEIIFSVVMDWQGSTGLWSISQVCWEWQKVALEVPPLGQKALSLLVNLKWMFEMLSKAPQLHILSLCGCSWHGPLGNNEALPDELLALSAPNLEHLAFDNFFFGWGALESGLAHSTKLSVLHICYPVERDTPYTPSVSELLATLVSIALLQELRLQNILKAINKNLFIEWDTPTAVLPALQILDLQANIQFCSSFLNGVKAPAHVKLDVECNTTDGADDAYQFMMSMFMIGISTNASCDPYDILTKIYHKSKLWQGCLQQDNGRGIVVPVKHLNMVSSLNLGNYPVPHILTNLYHNARGALEAKKQGKKSTILLPLLETITVVASLKLQYHSEKWIHTYHAVWEHITSWLEGNVTDAQMEDDNESVGDSDNAKD